MYRKPFEKPFHISLCLLAAALIFALPREISASYFAECDLRAEAIATMGPVLYSKKSRCHTIKGRFRILRVLRGGGHNPRHCNPFVNKTFTKTLILPSKKSASKIRRGEIIKLHFHTASGRTARGAFSVTRWRLKKR